MLEPTAHGAVKTARKGTGIFRVTATGVESHAGLAPQDGASAILALAEFVIAAAAVAAPEWGTTVNTGVVSGGSAVSVVAGSATAGIDIRVAGAAEQARVDAEFAAIEVTDPRVRIEVDHDWNHPPMALGAASAPLLDLARGTARAQGREELPTAAVGGASDANFVAALGLPVLCGMGATGDGAHARGEYILPDTVPAQTALVAGMLLRLTRPPRSGPAGCAPVRRMTRAGSREPRPDLLEVSSRPDQAVRLVPRLMQAMAEVLPLVEELVDVEGVAGATPVRDRRPDERGRADRFLADAPERVDDGHRELHHGVVGVQDDQFERGHLVQGDAFDAGQHHRGHRLRFDLGEHAVHPELVAAEFLGAHRDRDTGRGRAVGRAEVFVRHPHPTTIPAPRPEPVDHMVQAVHPVRAVRTLDAVRTVLAVRAAPALRATPAIHQVRPVHPVRLIHSVHTIDAIHMIGTIHTVHTVHTAAAPDPLRPAALDPVGAIGRDPVGTALYTVATGLGAVDIRCFALGVVGTVGVALLTVCVVGAVCTLRTVHARPTLRGVRGL